MGRFGRGSSAIGAVLAVELAAASMPAIAADGPPIPVTIATVPAKDMPIYVRGLGTVQAFNAVTVKSRVDGQIMEVRFSEGQQVKAGDQLFQIDSRPFQAALDAATAAKARDEAALGSAKLDLDRYEALIGKGFQTRQSYDQQKGQVAQDTALIAADEALIEAARLNHEYADVRSPIDGRTGARLVDVGNLVQASAGTGLVTITQVQPIYVSFTIAQDQLDVIRHGQAKGPLEVIAYAADDKTKLADGKLTLIDNAIDLATGTIHLKATFANDDERLWPGEFVNARLVLGTREKVPVVPAQTVMQGPVGAYVFVVTSDNTAHRRDVEVASTQDGLAVIAKGLTAGDRVVTDGQYRLSDGSTVVEATGPGQEGG